MLLQNFEKSPDQYELLKDEINKSHTEKLGLHKELDKFSKN